MSATAAPAPAAPAPAWLAAPAGDWKTLSAAMTAEVPAIAGRPVPVACAPGAGLGSPACYLRDIPVIEVDGDLLEADPDDCDPAIPGDRERYPVTWGALVHECAHAAHTQVRLPRERRANWCQAARQLEESRIESRQAGRRPADRRYLRASATKLVLADFTAAGAEPASPREAGAAAALLLAREDAGILEPDETAPVTAKVEAAIGTEAPRPAAGHLARVPRDRRRRPAHPGHPRPPLVPHPRPRPRRRPARPPGHQDPLRARQGPRPRHRDTRRGGRRRLRPAAAPLPARRRRQARAREGRPAATPSGPPARSSAAAPAPGRSPAPATPARRRPPPPAA